jgi:hypothetical protein
MTDVEPVKYLLVMPSRSSEPAFAIVLDRVVTGDQTLPWRESPARLWPAWT